MTSIVIASNQEVAGRTRQGIAPAQPCATRDSAQIKFTEHVGQGVFALSAICAGDGACVRAIGILGSLETETVAPQIQWPAPNSQSAAARFRSVIPAKLLPSGRWTAGSVLPFWRCFRLLYSFRPLKASGSLIQSGLECAVLQDPKRYLAKSFQVLSLSARVMGLAASVGRTPTSQKENRKCPTMQWRNPT